MGIPWGHTEFAQKTGTGLVIVFKGVRSRKEVLKSREAPRPSDHGIRMSALKRQAAPIIFYTNKTKAYKKRMASTCH